MIPRYTRPVMGRIWEDQNKYQRWLDVELAVVETLADEGVIPKQDAAEIRNRASFSVDRINQIEAEVKHDVIAFTTSVAEHVGPFLCQPIDPTSPAQPDSMMKATWVVEVVTLPDTLLRYLCN